jgi:hypothetical protein
MNTRSHFAWAIWEMATFGQREDLQEAQDLYDQEIVDIFRAKFPSRKVPMAHGYYTRRGIDWVKLRQAVPDEAAANDAKWRAIADELLAWERRGREHLKGLLRSLALCLDYERSPDEWHFVGASYDWTYSTQGYGASKYAQGIAEEIADKARAVGLPVRVEREHGERSERGTYPSARWAVYVETDALTARAIEYLPGPSVREWVRLCWKRGVNPRVYCPFLPVGYEEQAGLDHFGGERKAS